MIQPQIKGYNLSTDYKKLFELIQQGYRIPAWIVYSKEYKEPIIDLVEVKMAYKSDNRYTIGVRGHGYESWRGFSLEVFDENCKFLELKYIDPTKP